MNAQMEATVSLLAALLVLFSTLLDPGISATLVLLLVVVLFAYKFVEARRKP